MTENDTDASRVSSSSSPRRSSSRRPRRHGYRRPRRSSIGWAFDSTGRDGAVRRSGARRRADPREAAQRARRRHGSSARDQDLRHAGQQAVVVEGLCRQADRPGREDHLHDLRRRSRRTGHPGVAQQGPAHDRAVHRHRSDGAEALRRDGKLAFSFGNVAQDEGSAMAQFAWHKGWRTANLATDTVISYFKNITAAFAARWKQLGGKIVDSGDVPVGLRREQRPERRSAVSTARRDVIVTVDRRRVRGARSAHVGLRTLGNDTPILNSWAGDGTYWLPKSPQVTNYYFLTFANASAATRARRSTSSPSRSRRRRAASSPGSAAIDGVATAIRRAHGSTNGADARGGDGEVPEGADAVGPRQLLAEAAHGLRPAITA